MSQERVFKVGTYNVRGLMQAVEAVKAVRQKLGVHVLAVTETWMKPRKSMPLKLRAESATRDQISRTVGSGGVALLFQGTPKHMVIYRTTTPKFQAFAVKLAGIVFAAVYASPTIRVDELKGN